MKADACDILKDRQNRIEFGGYTVLGAALRSDGYWFLIGHYRQNTTLLIWAGCHSRWTLAQYRRHIKRDYPGSVRNPRGKQKETRLILDMLEATAKAKWSR